MRRDLIAGVAVLAVIAAAALAYSGRWPELIAPPPAGTAPWCGPSAMHHCRAQATSALELCQRRDCTGLCRPPADRSPLCQGCLDARDACVTRYDEAIAACGACPPGTSCTSDLVSVHYSFCCGAGEVPCDGRCGSRSCPPDEARPAGACACDCIAPLVRQASGRCACPACPIAGQVADPARACACACPAGFTVCNGRCVNLQADRANCGACGPAGACAPQEDCCGGLCEALTSDDHCGACFRAVPAGGTCCVRPGGAHGEIARLGTDEHCRACFDQCPKQSSSCCPADATHPTAFCANPASPQTCGGCTYVKNVGFTHPRACAGGETCCPPSGSPSPRGYHCAYLAADDDDCGTCNNACTGKKVCRSGACVCPSSWAPCGNTCCDSAMGQGCCNGQCVDIRSDPAHCGASCTPCEFPTCDINGNCGPPVTVFPCANYACQCPSGWPLCPTGGCCRPHLVCAAAPGVDACCPEAQPHIYWDTPANGWRCRA